MPSSEGPEGTSSGEMSSSDDGQRGMGLVFCGNIVGYAYTESSSENCPQAASSLFLPLGKTRVFMRAVKRDMSRRATAQKSHRDTPPRFLTQHAMVVHNTITPR